MRKAIAYLGYVLGLMLLVYLCGNHQEELHILASRNYDPFPLMVFSHVYPIMIGLYIALPRFIRRLKRKGELSIDWLQILIIGIPTLLISGSGILSHYFPLYPLNSLIGRVYVMYTMTGTTLIGVVCGYSLLNSIVKQEIVADAVPVVKSRIAKFFVLLILGFSLLYSSLSGFIHPLKLEDVQADIVKNDNQSGYLVNDGKDTVYFIQTEIKYRLKIENMPTRSIRRAANDLKIKIEPKEELQSLLVEDVFRQSAGYEFSRGGNETEITLTYIIGSIDPEGNNTDIIPPPPEVLEEIKDALYDAELIIEASDTDIKRFNLLDYKEN